MVIVVIFIMIQVLGANTIMLLLIKILWCFSVVFYSFVDFYGICSNESGKELLFYETALDCSWLKVYKGLYGMTQAFSFIFPFQIIFVSQIVFNYFLIPKEHINGLEIIYIPATFKHKTKPSLFTFLSFSGHYSFPQTWCVLLVLLS